ncbi:ParA family protein [Halococcus thailandensis]|uniref:Chromosome partitioning protein ParA n=1 Tax=Halococcus thailandensis JCM 13552 TaxID=1227457 RepID=M0NGI4_9EURY|nr:ParA family protein [Halococcus thailandensis]EMA55800.1 chromosome partitioning protein ParA [Halococcus thailandensis JCM 13552]
MDSTMRAAAFLDKGGVGKTTTVAHVGVALADEGYRVCLLDLAGKQGDLTKHFGLWQQAKESDDWPNITTVFQDEWDTIAEQLPDAVDQLIMPTGEGPDLIPAHEGLDGLESLLGSIDDPSERYARLDHFLTEYLDERYDVLLLDLPGSTSNIAYNGLWAARHVITPVRAGPFEQEQMAQLEADLDEIRAGQEIDITLALVLINEYDERQTIDRELFEQLNDDYGGVLAPEQIPSSQDITNAQQEGQTIFQLEQPSQTAQRALAAYRENARTLIDRAPALAKAETEPEAGQL